jgi:hypothetical protein
MVNIDNAPVDNSRMTQKLFGHNSLKRLPYLLYSPGMSPSDFYLFGKAKRSLIRQNILDKINLLEAFTEILNDISGAELRCAFGFSSNISKRRLLQKGIRHPSQFSSRFCFIFDRLLYG